MSLTVGRCGPNFICLVQIYVIACNQMVAINSVLLHAVHDEKGVHQSSSKDLAGWLIFQLLEQPANFHSPTGRKALNSFPCKRDFFGTPLSNRDIPMDFISPKCWFHPSLSPLGIRMGHFNKSIQGSHAKESIKNHEKSSCLVMFKHRWTNIPKASSDCFAKSATWYVTVIRRPASRALCGQVWLADTVWREIR
jgi:hypothetical protein